jgi:hypothetical protein
MPFKSPNYTQTPNDLIDVEMKKMGEAELKVVLAIVRQTIGYHRGVTHGAKLAEDHGYIRRTNPDTITSAEWELAVDEETPSLAEEFPIETPSLGKGVEDPDPSLGKGQVVLNKVNRKDNIYIPNPESVAIGIINSGKSHGKANTNWPADVKEWGESWNTLIGRQVSKTELGHCVKEFRELQARGIDLKLFETAYNVAVFFDGMSITHPLACSYAADEIRQGLRDETGARKNGKKRPGDTPKPLQKRPPSAPVD